MKQFAFICLAALLFTAACQNEARWYPSAEVSVGNHYEYTDAAGAKQLAVTLVVHNTGKTAVLSSTITVQVKTDQREYLQTAGFTNKIIPDGKVSLTVSVPYLNPAEQLAPDGVSIYGSFFD